MRFVSVFELIINDASDKSSLLWSEPVKLLAVKAQNIAESKIILRLGAMSAKNMAGLCIRIFLISS